MLFLLLLSLLGCAELDRRAAAASAQLNGNPAMGALMLPDTSSPMNVLRPVALMAPKAL